MLNVNLFIDGGAFLAGTVGLSKTPFFTSFERPLNLSGMAVSSATSALAFAAISERSDAEKAAVLACVTLFLCFIAKPLSQRTTILINPYTAVQLSAFHALLKVTLYGIYRLATHFTVSVSFNPTTTEDIKKISTSDLGTHKAEFERSTDEKWNTFNLNMQAAFNVMLANNSQTLIPFTNYHRVTLLAQEELKVFQDFLGDHAKIQEQSQVLFDHDLPPPSRFDALPNLSPDHIAVSKLSVGHLHWYYQAFRKGLIPPAQVSIFAYAFYDIDLLPPTTAFYTSLPIPRSSSEVSVNQAHYFVNYDHHHPEAFDKRTQEEQTVLNEIFIKAGKAPRSPKKVEKPPIETPAWSTAKKVMIYGGCALAVLALVALPTVCLLMQGSPQPLNKPLDKETSKTADVFNETFSNAPLNENFTCLLNEQPPIEFLPPVCFPPQHKLLPEVSKTSRTFNETANTPHSLILHPLCGRKEPTPYTHFTHPQTPPTSRTNAQLLTPLDMFPQNRFKIDLRHLLPTSYEPTLPDRAVSHLYPSLESRYVVCPPDEKPFQIPSSFQLQFEEVSRPTKSTSTLIEELCFLKPADQPISFLPPQSRCPNQTLVKQLQAVPLVLPPSSSFETTTSNSSYSWKFLAPIAISCTAVLVGVYNLALRLLRKPTRNDPPQSLVPFSETHMNSHSQAIQFIRQPRIDFGIDPSLWAIQHSLTNAFAKLSGYRIHSHEGVKTFDSNSSSVEKNFNPNELDLIAKLVARIAAEKAKVTWLDVESFSFDFFELGPNFNCVTACVQLTENTCERLRLPEKLFTDCQYKYPPPSENKDEPVLFDHDAKWVSAPDLEALPKLIEKLSSVSITLHSLKSLKTMKLDGAELADQLPYLLNDILTTKPKGSWDEQPRDSWASGCKVIKDLARKVAEETLEVGFEEIDSYDLHIDKTLSITSFIVTVTSNGVKSASARTFFSLQELLKVAALI